jgi:hypothetical protein
MRLCFDGCGVGLPSPDSREMADDDRLESWKDIAAYLRRDVRTVQRWEQTDGLPIHRHKRAHRPIPYAYKSEIDAWWTNRSDAAPPVRAEVPAADRDVPPSASRYAIAAAASLTAIAFVSAAYFTIGRHAARAVADPRAAIPRCRNRSRCCHSSISAKA